jgi:magnesium transporter
MMERLQRWQFFRMYPEDEDLLEDVITENQQAIEMTNISTNILSSTMDAFASIISNNLNAVMKFLASATIVVNLPTIVYSFFGMNVHDLPFAATGSKKRCALGIVRGVCRLDAYASNRQTPRTIPQTQTVQRVGIQEKGMPTRCSFKPGSYRRVVQSFYMLPEGC